MGYLVYERIDFRGIVQMFQSFGNYNSVRLPFVSCARLVTLF
uniref:Uncharacterized protein n=1 Tax=Anguilla anguilla TaxID=7936 RepID=A0A0E9TMD8_ANGAN